MFDVLVRGGTVVDGKGMPGYRADLGIRGGRVIEIGDLQKAAANVVNATGLVVAPGFIDPHTHYDAQLFWDPYASPSSWHGVTSVIGGNCGFTLAPLKQRDADYTRRMMANVEGMPLSGLEQGVPWTWNSFGDYLDALENGLAVNAGFLVGHCALRRYVLGDDFTREATSDEVTQLCKLLDESLTSGGIGLSTTRSSTHNDEKGVPVPSRWASEEELMALCEIVGRHDGMSLEMITEGCIFRFSDEEVDLMTKMSAVAGCPLNWNVLVVSSDERERIEHQLQPAVRARLNKARIVALTLPIIADMTQSFLSYGMLQHIPGFFDLLALEVPEQIRRLQDPAVRTALQEEAQASRWSRFADFSSYVVGEVFCPENEKYRNRTVGDIAAEQGIDAFSALVEILVADELRTVLWPPPLANGEADWALRREVWERPDVLLGGSDAGAHLDRFLGSPYATRFLADVLRGRRQLTLERAIQLLTDVPARLFGLRDRGRISIGSFADLVLFNPEQIDAGPAYVAYDLPGGGNRLLADSVGIEHVFVNGVETIVEGRPTGAIPGTLFRSGRDTAGRARSEET